MANHTGDEGTVKIGSDVIAEIRSFSLTETAELIEDTAKGDASKTYQAGKKDASGSLECWWDETDTTGQGVLVVGAQVALDLYPEGAATGDTYYQIAAAIITEVGRESPEGDGIVSVSFNFQASGGVIETTVS